MPVTRHKNPINPRTYKASFKSKVITDFLSVEIFDRARYTYVVNFIASHSTSAGARKTTNEDYVLVEPQEGFFCVCDGTSHPKGAQVAKQAAEFMREGWKRLLPLRRDYEKDRTRKNRQAIELGLAETIKALNTHIHGLAQLDGEKVGACTTIDFLGFVADQLVVAHIGDGRVLLYRENKITQLTRDHTRAEEMLASGLWTAEQLKGSPFRRELTRAVGAAQLIVPDLFSVPLQPGDSVVACTNGLTDTWEGPSSHAPLELAAQQPAQAASLAKTLVDQAVAKKASDNVSCAVISIPGAKELGEKTEVQGILANPKLMAALQRVTVFHSLRENQRAMVGLLSLATVRRYPAGAVLMAQGDASLELTVIMAGEVDILEFGNVVVTRKPGEALGEIGFFTQSPRSASAIAKTAADVLVIHEQDFQSLLARDPRLGLELAKGVIQELGRKLTEKARTQLWSG